MIDDARLLGGVKYAQKNSGVNGQTTSARLLQRKYFIDLVALITFHVRVEFKAEKAKLLEKRRRLYNDAVSIEDDTKYEDVVREIYLKQETLFNQLCEEVLEEFSIPREVFIESQSVYARDPATREEMTRALQTGRLSQETLQERPDLAKSMQATIGETTLLREQA